MLSRRKWPEILHRMILCSKLAGVAITPAHLFKNTRKFQCVVQAVIIPNHLSHQTTATQESPVYNHNLQENGPSCKYFWKHLMGNCHPNQAELMLWNLIKICLLIIVRNASKSYSNLKKANFRKPVEMIFQDIFPLWGGKDRWMWELMSLCLLRIWVDCNLTSLLIKTLSTSVPSQHFKNTHLLI